MIIGCTLPCLVGWFVYYIISNPLVALGDVVVLEEDEKVELRLKAGDTGADGLEYVVEDYPRFGEIAGIPPKLTYEPNKDFYGRDRSRFYVKNSKVLTLAGFIQL